MKSQRSPKTNTKMKRGTAGKPLGEHIRMRERLENTTQAAEFGGPMTGTRTSLHFKVQFLSLDTESYKVVYVGCKENVWRRILEKEE